MPAPLPAAAYRANDRVFGFDGDLVLMGTVSPRHNAVAALRGDVLVRWDQHRYHHPNDAHVVPAVLIQLPTDAAHAARLSELREAFHG